MSKMLLRMDTPSGYDFESFILSKENGCYSLAINVEEFDGDNGDLIADIGTRKNAIEYFENWGGEWGKEFAAAALAVLADEPVEEGGK